MMIEFGDRVLAVADRWIEAKYPKQQVMNAELFRKGDPLPEPKTRQEYEEFPSDQKGRFQIAIESARRGNADS